MTVKGPYEKCAENSAETRSDMTTMNDLIKPIPAAVPSPGQQAQIERKFGMFLHFGVNTFGNTEWSDGSIPAESYCPKQIDADQWIRTAYEAGMNFVVLVTKHHDGFCLWDTDTTGYSVKYSGNPTDVVAETAKACLKYGIKLGLYYSLWDRSAEAYRVDFEHRYLPYMLRHLTELMDGRYGEIVELWLDGQWDKTRKQWQLDKIYDAVKRMQPGCQIGINGTVGDDDDTASMPDEHYLPAVCREGDPLRMFPSDFRLWDPHPCRKQDPKIYTFAGQRYYLPFEMTVCSREGSSWFYSDTYEEHPQTDVDRTAADCQRAFDENNIVVINMPPDKQGRLVDSDIAHLMKISEKLRLRRTFTY